MDRRKAVDLIIFAGQSNMAGRGESDGAPMAKNDAMEFRAISDPQRLYPLIEPFGVNENNPQGIYEPKMKTGSLVSSFAETYTKKTKHQLIAVSASKGGSSIKEWQSNQPYLKDLIMRYHRAKEWLKQNNIVIKHQYLLWLQGETDGDSGMTSHEFCRLSRQTFTEMRNAGIEHIFLIQIGNHRDDKELYEVIQSAQEKMVGVYEDLTMVSTCLKKMSAKGLMKDSFHYYQAAYNECGREAALNVATYLEQKV